MAEIVYSDEAFTDLERIVEHLLESPAHDASGTLEIISSAIDILQVHPLIGRRIDAHIRELVISRGVTGYLVLYRFERALDVVRILRIRHQREAGYTE